MPVTSPAPRPRTTPPVAPPSPDLMRRVSWGAIFVGAVIAMALMVFFSTLGIGIGAGAVDPLYDREPLAGMATGSGIYLIVTQLIALGAGGYAAARLAGVPRLQASLLHGAAVWGLSTLLLAYAAVIGGGAAFGAATSALSSTAQGAASATRAVLPQNLSLPDASELTGGLSLSDLPDELEQTLRDNGITPQNFQEETTEAFRNVFSQQEQRRARNLLQSTIADVASSPGDAAADVNAALDQLVGGENAIISEEDAEEALQVLQDRLGITPEEAQAILDTAQQRIETVIAEVQQTVDAAQQRALEAAEAATNALSRAGWFLSIASILGLAAAVGGAFAGKPEDLIGDRMDDRARI